MDAAALAAENEALRAEVAASNRKVELLMEKLEALSLELARLKRQITGPKSERRRPEDDAQGSLFAASVRRHRCPSPTVWPPRSGTATLRHPAGRQPEKVLSVRPARRGGRRCDGRANAGVCGVSLRPAAPSRPERAPCYRSRGGSSMLIAIALSFAVAGAAEAAPADLPTHPYPLEIAGEGRTLRLLDPEGQVIPTPDALVLVGLPEAAETYRKAERTRERAANWIWIGSAALGVGSVLLVPSSVQDGGARLAAANLLVVPAVVGSGFLVRYVNPRARLGAWTDRETLESAVAAHAGGAGAESAVLTRVAVYETNQLFVNFDGRVVDAARRPVRMKELVERIDDPKIAAEYRRTRRIEKRAFNTSIAVGSGLTVLGGAVGIIGFINRAFGGDGGILAVGSGMLVLGVGGVGTGIVGAVVSTHRHEDPYHWFDEPTLRARLDAYERTLREDLALAEARRWNVDVHPLIGPGVVGVTGTF